MVVSIAVDNEIDTGGKASCMYKIAYQLTASAGRRNKAVDAVFTVLFVK